MSLYFSLLRRHMEQGGHNQPPQQQQRQQTNSGLTRYRSAPSSYFASLLNTSNTSTSSYGGDNLEQLLNPRGFVADIRGQNSSSNVFLDIEKNQQQNCTRNIGVQLPFTGAMKQEVDVRQQGNEFSQMVYPSQGQQQTSGCVASTLPTDQSYKLMGSINSESWVKTGASSNLTRYNSSPATILAQISIENELGAMRGMGSLGAGNSANAEASFSSSSRFKNQMDFSSGQPSSSGLLTPISEIDTKGVGEDGPNDRSFRESHRNDEGYITGFPITSWDDSTLLCDDFLKELGDEDSNAFSNSNAMENQGQIRSPTLLSRHLSLPSSTAELSAVEKMLQDSVPCKIRAKRGCATHPRSIAERVRRTRISERMRRLQELVPNMDKQTNTADMLDLAVDYIKDLENQVKTLSDIRAKCKCSAR